ncbi:MAG TPA: DNA polymerase Y family protein [Dongiaceae bacterium]|nr:DNA polymerase Y family protein [Dongiaceae bacterium]
MKRIVSLWLPSWATDRLHRKPDCPADRPVVTIEEVAGRLLIQAADALAGAEGIRPGFALADARALRPDLAVFPADPAGDATALARLADWCSRYTPLVALDGGDGLWLDITGCAHLFGGEKALMSDLRHRLAGFGHDSRIAVADSPGAAWAAARFREAGQTVVEPGAIRESLAPLPVAALRLPSVMTAELERLGLRRIGDLYSVARAALARRFGMLPGERLDQALGRIAEPLSPRLPPPAFVVRQILAEPILHAEGLAAVLQRLLPRLCRELAEAGQGARRLELGCYRVDGRLAKLAVGTSRPSRDDAALIRLFAEKLERIDPGFGIEAMTLAAPQVEPLADLQLALARGRHGTARGTARGTTWGTARGTTGGTAGQAADLAPLIDRLGNRLGFARLARAEPRESHFPERAVKRMPAGFPAAAAKPAAAKPPGALPLRLFPRPEPVTAEAAGEGDPPASFLWRARRHQIRTAEGPARIEPEWWLGESGGPRDYWRLEDEAGLRFWLFGQSGSWYLHGLFA